MITNLVIFFLILFIPPIILASYKKTLGFYRQLRGNHIDQRANLPLYKDKKFSKKLFSELNKSLSVTHRSFIGWRRKPIKLKYTNISGIYNTRVSLGESLYNSAWFFGGSTIFGAGAEDSGTIPSIYHLKSDKPVMNFGESGWVSRQSLNLLI